MVQGPKTGQEPGQRKPYDVLVTGGAGFIGSHVCEALLEDGLSVVCLDDLSTGKRSNIAHLLERPHFLFKEADIGDARLLREVMVECKALVHLAALGSVPRSIAAPLDTERVNLADFVGVLEVARAIGLKRVVYASSSSVYGDSAALPKREGNEGHPLSPYAVTKAMDEVYASLYTKLFGLETIGLRFFNVFGERQDPQGPYAAAIPRFISALLAHRRPVVHGDGGQTRDFTYVLNAVEAVRCGLLAPATLAGEVFNIAYGQRCSLVELLAMMQQRMAELDPPIAAIVPDHGPERAGDVRDSLADVGKAREQLGYRPRFTLEQGLDKAIPWYVANWR